VSERGRRQLLEVAALGTGACAVGLCAWPFAAALVDAPVEAARDAPFTDLAADAEVREGEPVKAFARAPRRDGWSVETRDVGAVWLVRLGGQVRAFSGVCPHLGCVVDRDKDGKGFACPCHASHFTADGTVQGGPAPRGLDPLPVKVEGGRVLVQVLQFAPGTRERKAV
jgi:Rieske Fe-S protein